MRLYIKQKFFSFGDKYNIFDENDNPVYQVAARVFTLGAKIHLHDMAGRELYYIEQKLFKFLPTYLVFQEGDLRAEIKKEFSFFKPRLSIGSSYGNFEIEGGFMAMDFQISQNGMPIGSIHKEWFAFTDCYELDVADGVDPAFFVAMVIAIDNCLHNGNNNNN